MEKTPISTKLVVVVFAVLMLSSGTILFASAHHIPIQTPTAYGDITQYDWPQGGSNEGNTGYNLGPAPDRPNVLWKVATPGTGMVSVFDGKAYVIEGSQIGGVQGTALHAFNAFTGEKIWDSLGNVSINGVSGVSKLDDNYLFGETTTAMICIRISDGKVMWTEQIPNGVGHPGSGTYFAGQYSDSMKLHFAVAWDDSKNQAQVLCYDLSDPTKAPPIKWTYIADSPSEILCSGGGKVYLGTTEATVYALDGATGERVWQTHTKGGLVQQNAMFYDGNLYTSAVSTQLTCFDGTTGDIVWQYEKGPRTFSAYRGAAGYGIIYDATVEVDPHGYVRAWDAATGELLWKQPAYYNIHYATMALADGKLYSSTCDQAAGAATAGLVMPGYETSCMDAFTGEMLWKLKGINFATPSIAYGNLYGLANGYLYCIGSSAADWSHGFVGNVDNPRIAIGQSAPADISTPTWTFQTDGDISSSPAVVDGKVYFGSHDQNWYCLNAYTGEKIWNYSLDFYVRSSAAVVGGRVFTGADDGYFYALDANTGQKIWQTSAGGLVTTVMVPTEFNPRSSPIVVGDWIYVGALDGKVYCLSTSDGNVKWTYSTGGPVVGSPAYSNGVVYITSTDTYLYALNAADGTLKWKSIPLSLDVVAPARSNTYNIGTPTVANGTVYIGGGVQYGTAIAGYNYTEHGMSTPSGAWGGTIRYAAFDAATGASIWNITRAGNTQPGHVPAIFNGQLYAGEFFVITSMNTANPNSGNYSVPDFGQFMGGRLPGNRTWGQWLGYQISSSVAYADDITGSKVYIGCDIGSVYCLDATTGKTLSVFTTKGNVASSPAVWDGKMYIGSTDGILYCFDNAPVLSTSLNAEANKGSEMWSNETLVINGQLMSNPDEMTWDNSGGIYVPIASDLHPGIPNATITVSFTKPDMSSVNVTAITDNHGKFTVSYTPSEVGSWGWVAYYDGIAKTGITYDETYGAWNPISVVAAPGQPSTPQSSNAISPAATQTVAPDTTSPSQTQTTQNNNIPMEYIYAAIAVVVVVVVVVGAYAFTRRSKKANP
jgi:outer membrane protein assembly factor BamB